MQRQNFVVEEAAALASRLKHRLVKKDWTISTAESCTGGMISSLLTDISGASACFKQGWIVYSNESKMRELGVESTAFDAVSYTHLTLPTNREV